jgi:hypothetical protein
VKPRDRETPADSEQRSSLTPLGAAPAPDGCRFIEEATRLAIESVEKGWGGPFGAVIVKDGAIVGRGQNRVPLTGCPVYHAEINWHGRTAPQSGRTRCGAANGEFVPGADLKCGRLHRRRKRAGLGVSPPLVLNVQ